MSKRETALQKAILQTLRWRYRDELLIERINAGVVMVGDGDSRRPFAAAPAGWSDLTGCLAPSGRFVALEVKCGNNKPTAKQRAFLALVRGVGGFAAVVRSVDEAVEAIGRAMKGERE